MMRPLQFASKVISQWKKKLLRGNLARTFYFDKIICYKINHGIAMKQNKGGWSTRRPICGPGSTTCPASDAAPAPTTGTGFVLHQTQSLYFI